MKYHFSPMKIQHSLIERYDSYLSKNVFIHFLNLVKKKLSSNIFSKRIGNGKMSASRNATEEYQKFTKIGTQYVFKVLHTCIQLTDLMGRDLKRYWLNCMGGLPPHRKKNISSINWVKLLCKGLWTKKSWFCPWTRSSISHFELSLVLQYSFSFFPFFSWFFSFFRPP